MTNRVLGWESIPELLKRFKNTGAAVLGGRESHPTMVYKKT
jgi:hypothetical protein